MAVLLVYWCVQLINPQTYPQGWWIKKETRRSPWILSLNQSYDGLFYKVRLSIKNIFGYYEYPH